MSYDHSTGGYERYESFVAALRLAGVTVAETLLEESHQRGTYREHGCVCGYVLDFLPVGPVVETTTEYSDQEFEGVIQEALEPQYHPEARDVRRNYLTHGRITCPCCLGTCGHIQHLRLGRFTRLDGVAMVVEEYLEVDDQDCDGVSMIGISTYEDGKRPSLVTITRAA